MKSILDNDEETVNDGKLLMHALNSGISNFTPDLLFEKLVTSYKSAKKIYGPTFLREVTGYSEGQVERNKHISEFTRELKRNIEHRLKELKKQGYLDRDGNVTSRGLTLSQLILYTEELDKLAAKGILGEREHKKAYEHGMKEDVKPYAKGRYRDIALRKSIRRAVKRGHTELLKEDLMSFERMERGKRILVYALDASGSMKGQKLEQCKKAGIALAYKAIQEGDAVGLIVFGKDIKTKVTPTRNFKQLLSEITIIHAKERTNIAHTIKEAIGIFPKEEATKHIVLITDAMPTSGAQPEQESVQAAHLALQEGVSVSIIGVQLQKDGEIIAQKIAEAGNGRLFSVRELENIDAVVLQDYYSS